MENSRFLTYYEDGAGAREFGTTILTYSAKNKYLSEGTWYFAKTENY
jgi:hypothetical protein